MNFPCESSDRSERLGKLAAGYFLTRSSKQYKLPGKNPHVQNSASRHRYTPFSAPVCGTVSGNLVGGSLKQIISKLPCDTGDIFLAYVVLKQCLGYTDDLCKVIFVKERGELGLDLVIPCIFERWRLGDSLVSRSIIHDGGGAEDVRCHIEKDRGVLRVQLQTNSNQLVRGKTNNPPVG